MADTIMLYSDLRRQLQQRLREAPPIKHSDGRMVMSPQELDQATAAAVLVPVVARESGATILLTQRTAHLAAHAGQISFPGGRLEPDDPSAEEAALRETEEEIGLARRHISVLGRMPDYFIPTGFRVTPVVGWVEPPFTLALDSFEVEEAFEVPLSFFLDPANHQRGSGVRNGKPREFFVMPYEGRNIWGATAGMLHILYQIWSGRSL